MFLWPKTNWGFLLQTHVWLCRKKRLQTERKNSLCWEDEMNMGRRMEECGPALSERLRWWKIPQRVKRIKKKKKKKFSVGRELGSWHERIVLHWEELEWLSEMRIESDREMNENSRRARFTVLSFWCIGIHSRGKTVTKVFSFPCSTCSKNIFFPVTTRQWWILYSDWLGTACYSVLSE